MAPSKNFLNQPVLDSNPYPSPKPRGPALTDCELCGRIIKSTDWNAHKNSKKHRALEDAERNQAGATITSPTTLGVDSTGFTIDAPTDESSKGHIFGSLSAHQDHSSVENRACHGCGQTGHQKRDCPQGGSDPACYSCGQKRDCHQGKAGSNSSSQICFNCGRPGHRKVDCPQPPKPLGGSNLVRGDRRSCHNCGQNGHLSKDCDKSRVQHCRNCEDEGHISKDCPKPKNWSRVKCNNCQEYGHTVKRCKKPVVEVVAVGWGDGSGNEDAFAPGSWADSGSGNVATAAAAVAWDDPNQHKSIGDWADDITGSAGDEHAWGEATTSADW